nr:Chain L24E, 50S ribosomal protein L24e [Sulfolobus acidocaldarius DSM 639]8HKV_L24E Chain L24E, 50S ribosomal protein L24e [Sulfolobus acidocaldarius DSM 639]8HKY_L24E Chain L24E, 50S ribosomal protein L24e [Sulfolobus acidocaldarius DSM 639]8HKZ_L24E Chain L24E, 50S ribosomal protein L24e [Sulfolobus acidocaldarius DSM 639]8HL1_L24E Chain L24E, 50S ribosomal protein L24e [Sulfolobus acidocaldarius DSM 639]8HL2_L24E Chain L24E, 50S ribosomal protein L24e [Sulfolobus acidocaldarius DSM 639]
RQCSFCGKDILPGTGLMYVRNDGSLLWFCSSKCRKSMLKLHRDPKKLKWTKSYL